MKTLTNNKIIVAALTLALAFTASKVEAAANINFEFPEGEPQNGVSNDLVSEAQNLYRDVNSFLGGMGFNNGAADAAITVKVFLNSQTLQASAGNNSAHAGGVWGFYHHQDKYIGLLVQSDAAATKRILRHELIHLELHRRLQNAPAMWVDEGMAEWLSTDPQGVSSASTGNFPVVLRNTLKIAQAQGQVQSLETLFNQSYDAFYGEGRVVRYAQSAALLAYIFATERPEVVQNFLKEGSNAGTFLKDKIANGDLAQYEQKFMNWVAQN